MAKKTEILIVDDDPGMVRTTALILGRKGYAVSTAKDGREAIDKVKEQSFDMIFLDIQMPLMDGVETYRQVKAIRPEATVMMMTAYAVEDLVQQVLKEGAYGILYKPLDIDRALAVIEEAKAARKGALILVVDDDPAICATLRNILVKSNYEVRIAHSGEDAIAAAREKAYDVVLIDLHLPTINGLETYLAIRANDPEMVAIMMTGYRQRMAKLVEQALQGHAYACLYKPIDVEELLKLIDEIWRRKQKA